jgi:hypothetical protein
VHDQNCLGSLSNERNFGILERCYFTSKNSEMVAMLNAIVPVSMKIPEVYMKCQEYRHLMTLPNEKSYFKLWMDAECMKRKLCILSVRRILFA